MVCVWLSFLLIRSFVFCSLCICLCRYILQFIMQNSELTCFQTVEILLKVAIEPVYTAHPIDAVKQQLNNSLFKYSDKIQGIPLSYSELRFPKGKEFGRIMTDQPWIHVDVLTKLTVFSPVVGTKLEGKISRISDNNISILVIAMFNASISYNELHLTHKYDSSSNSWVSSLGELSEGDNLVFEIVSFQHSNGVVQIEGKLL